MQEQDVRRAIHEFVDGQITLTELRLWLAAATWGLGMQDGSMRSLVYSAKEMIANWPHREDGSPASLPKSLALLLDEASNSVIH